MALRIPPRCVTVCLVLIKHVLLRSCSGGDNSNRAKGNFYEGFMATGVASEATDEAIQANIVAAQYSGFSFPPGEGPEV